MAMAHAGEFHYGVSFEFRGVGKMRRTMARAKTASGFRIMKELASSANDTFQSSFYMLSFFFQKNDLDRIVAR